MGSLRRTVTNRFEALRYVRQQSRDVVLSSASIVFLMRGLPSCGKSHTARRLAGSEGVIFETDQFFLTEIGNPDVFEFDPDRMDDARAWNFERFQQAVQQRRSPVVVDRGNGRNAESRAYVEFARQHEYDVEIAEPDSAWWREIKMLLRYRPHTDEILDEWARLLAKFSRQTHNVRESTIRDWMDSWWDDLTVADILAADSPVEI